MLNAVHGTDTPIFFPGPATGLAGDYSVVIAAPDGSVLDPSPTVSEVGGSTGLYMLTVPGTFLASAGNYYCFATLGGLVVVSFADFIIVS